MKNSKFIGEIIISIALVTILLMFLDPVSFVMPQVMHPLMAPTLIVLLVIFTAFLWKEKPGDEREQMHKFIASRFAYFAGIVTVTIGIMFQSVNHVIDPWLIITASVILLAKIVGLVYGYIKH